MPSFPRDRLFRLAHAAALLALILSPGLVLAAQRIVVAELYSTDG